MRGAWCEYDVAMHLATRYKVISKLLFFTSLMVAWAMVLVGVAKVPPPPPHAALRCLPVTLCLTANQPPPNKSQTLDLSPPRRAAAVATGATVGCPPWMQRRGPRSATPCLASPRS